MPMIGWVVDLVARAPARVQVKLLAAFLTIAMLLIMVGAVGLQVLSGVNERTEKLIGLQRKIEAYRQVQHDTISQLYSVSSALLSSDDRTLSSTLRQLNQFGYDVDRLQFVAKDEVELLGQFRQDYDRFVEIVTHGVDMIRSGRAAEAREIQAIQAAPLADRLERLTNQLVNKAEADMIAGIETSRQAYDNSQLIVIAFALGSILLALALGYTISWSLIGPVKQIEAQLNQVAAGDFTQRVDVINRDELGALGTDVNKMSEELGRLYQQLRQRTNDLTESLEDLRTAQDRLVQSEKLASLGQVTAGIAHEIKNPLNFVNNFSAVSVELIDELREALGGAHLDSKLRAEISEIADTLQSNLDKVVQHGKRADAIVKNMLLHSRQGSGEHRPVDINALVDESLNLAYHGARAEKQGFNITLERSFDPTAGEVDLFPQEITRALLNLISNGFYAATKRKTEVNGDDCEPTLTAATKNLGDSVEIKIRDNGTGIPPEVKQKLFNPFFTTKPAGEGTGLGLSISHDIIVKQHGGSIEVDTQLGEFTEFRIVLPRAGTSLMKSGERM
jgi:signal transduction histidine kinase